MNEKFPKVVYYMGFEADKVKEENGIVTYLLDNGMKLTLDEAGYDNLKKQELLKEGM